MLEKLEIVIVVITISQEKVLEKTKKFLPDEHVRSALNTVLFEDGVVICLLRSVERSGIIFAKPVLKDLWRLSFICTDEEVSIPGLHNIRAINREVVMGMNAEHLFD